MTSEFQQILGEKAESVILAGYIGSIAHGTIIPGGTDDKDVVSVSIGSVNNYFGLSNFEGFRIQKDEWDICGYELRKFFRLLLKQNPNVLGLLWLRREHYIHLTEIGQSIIDSRDLFSSKQAYKSFTGYAYGQLHRMTAFKKYEGYMGQKRKAVVDKFGFDVKNASHLIRLLKMGIEFMSTGELNVMRHDNNMLIDIKRGKWSLEKIKAEAQRLFALADEALVNSHLPNKPDSKGAEKLLIGILDKHFSNKGGE